MKKLLTILFVLFGFTAMAQPCADEDTVRSNAVTLITATSARINGSISHFASGYTTLYLQYVRVGQTDTATTSGVSPLRNLTGLQPNTQYYYYYKTICVSGTNRQLGPYYFTTAINTVVYATERSTKFPYAAEDSGLKVPRADTSLYRAPDTGGGDIMFKTSDKTMYYYNGTRWTPMAVDSGGYLALLNNKVDSVTVDSVTNRLYYWKMGVSYGYALPLDSAYVDATAVNDSTLMLYRLNGDSTDVVIAGAGGTPKLSSIRAASASNDIDNGNFPQIWRWNSLNNQNGLSLMGVTTGSISPQSNFSSIITGNGATNKAAYLSASGGTNNYALIAEAGLVGIGTSTPDASAQLDVRSTTRGVKFPTLSGAQMTAISSPATGLIVYNSDSTALCFYNGSAWLKVSQGGGGTLDSAYILQQISDSIADKANTNFDNLTISTIAETSIGAGVRNIANRNGKWLKGKKIYLFADSYGVPTGASSTDKGWAQLMAKALGAELINYSVQGTSMENRVPVNLINGPNMVQDTANIPIKTFDDGLLIMARVTNDIIINSPNYNAANYISDASLVINNALSKGWDSTQIFLMGSYWIGTPGFAYGAAITGTPAATVARQDSFINAIETLARTYHLQYFDIRQAQRQFDTTNIMSPADYLHLNDTGHAFVAAATLQCLNLQYSSATGGKESIENVIFTSVTNITNTDTLWYATSGSGYGQTGLASTYLRANKNGRVILDAASTLCVYGFNSTNAQIGYAGMEAAIVIAAGNVYKVDNGVLSSPLVATVGGYKYSVARIGSAFKLQYSSDNGNTWVDIVTFTYTSSAAMYIVTDINSSGGLLEPEFYQFIEDVDGAIIFSDGFAFGQDGNNLVWDNTGKRLGIGTPTPTALLHLGAGTATAGTAPIKLNAGTALTTPEDGVIEYHGSHIYFTIGSTRYQLDQQAGTNLGNSDLTQTGGNRTYTGAGQNLIFNGSGGTSLFNVEYNSIILTAQNSGVNIQGDSILISANVGKVYIDSLPPSIDAIDSVVVITPTGQLKQKAQSDLVGGLLSGTYTPTLTNVANVAASTAYSCQYSRVGTVVTVSGEVDIDPTTTLTLTQLGISLPIASNLTATNELGGISADDLGTAARVAGDATNNRAELRMTPTDVTNRRFSFTFTYRVL